jgi:hypothetical protein
VGAAGQQVEKRAEGVLLSGRRGVGERKPLAQRPRLLGLVEEGDTGPARRRQVRRQTRPEGVAEIEEADGAVSLDE